MLCVVIGVPLQDVGCGVPLPVPYTRVVVLVRGVFPRAFSHRSRGLTDGGW